LLAKVKADDTTVSISSHVLSELERVVVLEQGRFLTEMWRENWQEIVSGVGAERTRSPTDDDYALFAMNLPTVRLDDLPSQALRLRSLEHPCIDGVGLITDHRHPTYPVATPSSALFTDREPNTISKASGFPRSGPDSGVCRTGLRA